MTSSGLIVALGLAHLCLLPLLQAKSQCPGSAASLIPRFVRGALIIVPIRINQSGPYDFLVDTGTQITVMDPSLALELGLKPQGTVGLVSVSSYAQASITVLDWLEAGSHTVEKPLAVIQDLQEIQTADRRIRGVLGENFLAHFDLLIDYPHKLLCLDETNEMRESVRGEHIPLVPTQDTQVNCHSRNAWMSSFISQVLEAGRFYYSWIPAVTALFFMRIRNQDSGCSTRLCDKRAI